MTQNSTWKVRIIEDVDEINSQDYFLNTLPLDKIILLKINLQELFWNSLLTGGLKLLLVSN